jgi:DNA modification methylase
VILVGDAASLLETLTAESAQCCVTSPPYWGLRDYGVAGQLGQETTPEEYVENLMRVMRGISRVLRTDGTLWLNLGDSYAGSPGGYQGKNGARASRTFTARINMRKGTTSQAKQLIGIPWRVAFAMQAEGWYLRSEIIWHKPNPMPESVGDRPSRAHEQLFLLTRRPDYFYDADAIREPISASTVERWGEFSGVSDGPKRLRPNGKPTNAFIGGEETCGVNPDGRNARSVWTIACKPFLEAHFATFPEEIPRRCILAGTRVGDTVIDPFCGSGTTLAVADAHQRKFIGIELNPEYAEIAKRRVNADGAPLFSGIT